MVLPVGFFMPLPLAMMIPFMGIQSAVMAKQFGENFQFGKRRISAMSNDEFNKLTPKIIMQNANTELAAMIPDMKQSIASMNEFQTFIIKEFLDMLTEFIHDMPQFLLDILGIKVDLHPGTDEHTTDGTTTDTTTDGTTAKEFPTYPWDVVVKQISDLQTMPLDQLAIMRNDALLGLYTAEQKDAIMQAYNERTGVQETTPNPDVYDEWVFAEFLQWLTAITDFLAYKELPWFKTEFGAVNGTRNSTQSSNIRLETLKKGAAGRPDLYLNEEKATGNSGEANKYFDGYKLWITLEWFHQLIFISQIEHVYI